MISKLLNITVIAEILSFLSAALLLNSKTKSWQLFTLFLFITIVVESIGWYMHWHLGVKQNDCVFNILMIGTTPFLLYIFSKSERLEHCKREMLNLAFAFVLIAVFNMCLFQGFWNYNKYSDIAGSFIAVYISTKYLLIIVKDDKSENLLFDEYFWLSNGLVFYSLGGIIIYVFFESLRQFHKATSINVFGYINTVLNILLYLSLTIAFICRRINTKQ